MPNPFFVKDCALAVVATGKAVSSLVEFRDTLSKVPISSLYFHFWGGRLRSTLSHPEFHNDFARWTYASLHDHILSERLAIVDPTDYKDLEETRQAVLDLIEERIDEVEHFYWSKEHRFHFLSSTIIIFEKSQSLNHPQELKNLIPTLTLSSLYYHFIDSRLRTPEGKDDFSLWLKGFGNEYETLVTKIQLIDPYFLSLNELKMKLIEITQSHLT